MGATDCRFPDDQRLQGERRETDVWSTVGLRDCLQQGSPRWVLLTVGFGVVSDYREGDGAERRLCKDAEPHGGTLTPLAKGTARSECGIFSLRAAERLCVGPQQTDPVVGTKMSQLMTNAVIPSSDSGNPSAPSSTRVTTKAEWMSHFPTQAVTPSFDSAIRPRQTRQASH